MCLRASMLACVFVCLCVCVYVCVRVYVGVGVGGVGGWVGGWVVRGCVWPSSSRFIAHCCHLPCCGPLQASSDIWSAAVSLYMMLARRLPFGGTSTRPFCVPCLGCWLFLCMSSMSLFNGAPRLCRRTTASMHSSCAGGACVTRIVCVCAWVCSRRGHSWPRNVPGNRGGHVLPDGNSTSSAAAPRGDAVAEPRGAPHCGTGAARAGSLDYDALSVGTYRPPPPPYE